MDITEESSLGSQEPGYFEHHIANDFEFIEDQRQKVKDFLMAKFGKQLAYFDREA